MGSKPKTPPQDPALAEINQITLLRLKREEEMLSKDEAERERLIAAGQRGRSALLTQGYLGPGSSPLAPRSPRTAIPRPPAGSTSGRSGGGKLTKGQALGYLVWAKRRQAGTP